MLLTHELQQITHQGRYQVQSMVLMRLKSEHDIDVIKKDWIRGNKNLVHPKSIQLFYKVILSQVFEVNLSID